MNSQKSNLTAFFEDTPSLERQARIAVRDAVLRHKLLGQPIVVWRDGQVVWVPPEEIEVAPEEPPHSAANGVAPS